jgi:hypothetical protein
MEIEWGIEFAAKSRSADVAGFRADRRRLGHCPETAFEGITMSPASSGCALPPTRLKPKDFLPSVAWCQIHGLDVVQPVDFSGTSPGLTRSTSV